MKPSKAFKSSSNTYSFLYRLIDLAGVFLSLRLATALYHVPFTAQYLIAALVVSIIFMYFAEAFGLYRCWRIGRLSEMVLTAWGAMIVSFFILLALAFGLKQSEYFSRVTFVIWFCFDLGFIFFWRMAQHRYERARRISGHNIKKVAIIGATRAGGNILNEISQRQELGYEFVGFYDDRTPKRTFGDLHLNINGKIDQAINLAREGEVDTIFVALPLSDEKRIAGILRRLGDTTVDVHVIPNFLMSNLLFSRIAHVGDIDTLNVFDSPYHGANEWLKRTEDIVISCLILCLIALPLIMIALGVKLTSRGPVFFKQRRYGLRGEEILVWKFRSMYVMENDNKVIQATKHDSRVTPLGAFLRCSSLDELPQFFNVLMGDMSIVGPRPHAVAHNEEYRTQIQFYMLRHKVKPGITGWAQVNGWRGETDTLEKMEKRVEFDLHYIKYWSVWFDIKIIYLTIIKGFVDKKAY